MRIAKISPQPQWVSIVADDGRIGSFDVSPFLTLKPSKPSVITTKF